MIEDVMIWVDKPVDVGVRMAEDREKWKKTTQFPNGGKATGVT